MTEPLSGSGGASVSEPLRCPLGPLLVAHHTPSNSSSSSGEANSNRGALSVVCTVPSYASPSHTPC